MEVDIGPRALGEESVTTPAPREATQPLPKSEPERGARTEGEGGGQEEGGIRDAMGGRSLGGEAKGGRVFVVSLPANGDIGEEEGGEEGGGGERRRSPLTVHLHRLPDDSVEVWITSYPLDPRGDGDGEGDACTLTPSFCFPRSEGASAIPGFLVRHPHPSPSPPVPPSPAASAVIRLSASGGVARKRRRETEGVTQGLGGGGVAPSASLSGEGGPSSRVLLLTACPLPDGQWKGRGEGGGPCQAAPADPTRDGTPEEGGADGDGGRARKRMRTDTREEGGGSEKEKEREKEERMARMTAAMRRRSPADALSTPDEVMQEIFSYFGIKEVVRLRLVCRRWRGIING